MDYTTTNFNDDTGSLFTAPFPLLSLPLEVLYKIIIFLDFPDLINISKTCFLLERIANDRFIYSSRFLYTKSKIGISIQNRPSVDYLYDHHIMPVKSPIFNPNQLLLVSMLRKSFVKDNLAKNLRKRPSSKELKQKNILRSSTNEFIQSKIKEFKKQNLSSVLSVYVNSYKFHQKASTTEDEYKSLLSKFYSSLRKINPTKNSPPTSPTSPTSPTNPSPTSNGDKKSTATKFLNHITEKTTSKTSSRSISHDSKVFSKKQYFENLMKNDSTSFSKSRSISDSVGSTSDLNAQSRPGISKSRKPSRTLLRASVDETRINYEKVKV